MILQIKNTLEALLRCSVAPFNIQLEGVVTLFSAIIHPVAGYWQVHAACVNKINVVQIQVRREGRP